MYKTVDLCAGIGGIRRGFERTGHFKNVISAEIDEYACRTYSYNFNGENPRNDLTSRSFKRDLENIRYDVLMAGFPCQPFSSQGNKEGFGDPTKGTIFFHIKQIIKRTRPKVVFLENVQNIVSHDNGKTIHIILDSLENKLNYKVVGVEYSDDGTFIFKHNSFVRNTKDFGLPQNRPRAYFIAFDRKLYGNLLDGIKNALPTELPTRLKRNPRLGKSLESIIEPQVDLHYYMSSDYLETLRTHRARQHENGNGFGYCILNEGGEFRKNANTILATGGSGKERNLIIQPMPEHTEEDLAALRKKGGLNNYNVRTMTPKEWGKLQGFFDYGFYDEEAGVDTFRFPDAMPEGQKYKQFGNSVSIPVVETMAYFIWDMLRVLNKNAADILRNYQMNYQRNHMPITPEIVRKCVNVGDVKAQRMLDDMVISGVAKVQIIKGESYYNFM